MRSPVRLLVVCKHVATIAASLFAAAASAQVANYPAKAVRIVVPFTAGSPVEIPARPVAQRLAEALGQQFLIDNRPGASGTIATEAVAKGPKDGYTILMTNCSHSSNPAYYRKLPVTIRSTTSRRSRRRTSRTATCSASIPPCLRKR